MPYYGDISGDFRNLLNESCDVVTVAVVGGDLHDCYRCPKRAVRNIQYMDEAKWYEMEPNEKRRFIDCLADNQADLEFGYAVFEMSDFTTLDSHYKLFQDVSFPPVWDIAIRAFAYIEILEELAGGSRAEFYADQFRSAKQSDELCDLIEEFTDGIDVECVSSKQVDGVQAADCLAGAVSEQRKGGTPWLDHFGEEANLEKCSHWALAHLEHKLTE
ncbi:hypothetical protein GCM10009006_37870 [Haloarcula argentinensis]|uniref:Uncharacterized protein n=2 Tax=Haloarcula argentinensis TaxID=43776 RepID=A0A830FXC6_HALAR|nr:hypothetical protein GCM10009006_37870 [Haloarcula argentinensis]